MILQNILFPDARTSEKTELFFRKSEKELRFDTYFNVFSIKKWKRYTVLRRLSLRIRAKGSFCVRIYDEKTLLQEQNIESMGEELTLPVQTREDSELIYFTLSYKEGFPAELLAGAFVTEQEPVHSPSIALNICTYHREGFVHRNLQLLKERILEQEKSPLYGKLEVFLVDNGESLQAAEMATDKIHLFYNRNSGGSGGFARGAMEMLRHKAQFTHLIFMDDDIVIEPEALLRTYALLSLLREEYQRSPIAGAMLRQDLRHIQHEAGAEWAGTDPIVFSPGLDLSHFENVCRNEKLRKADYAAWWFACYPLSVVREDNLPFPFFLHMDDVEYGIRNRQEIILLNGICVWHQSFEDKRGSTLSYYDIRNMLITNAVHTGAAGQRIMLRYALKRILANTLRYRYRDNELVYAAVRDFLRGPEYLSKLDPCLKNQELMRMGYKPLPVEQLGVDRAVLEEISSYQKPIEPESIYQHKDPEAARKRRSLNGWLLPADNSRCFAHPMGATPYALYREKRVLLFEPESKTGIVVEKSYRGLLRALFLSLGICWRLSVFYKKACREYKSAFPRMICSEFWRSYLGLEEKM